MARIELSERIKNAPLILDGAMGTELIGRGIAVPGCNDNLNVESPDDVIAVHASYLEAGSDAVITNTFSANSFGLARHNLVLTNLRCLFANFHRGLLANLRCLFILFRAILCCLLDIFRDCLEHTLVA